jgi:hypothetical protein
VIHGTVFNAAYLLHSEPTQGLPPILVVVQNTINSNLMEEFIKYSLSLYEELQVYRVLFTLLVEGCSNDEIKSKFRINQGVAEA